MYASFLENNTPHMPGWVAIQLCQFVKNNYFGKIRGHISKFNVS